MSTLVEMVAVAHARPGLSAPREEIAAWYLAKGLSFGELPVQFGQSGNDLSEWAPASHRLGRCSGGELLRGFPAE